MRPCSWDGACLAGRRGGQTEERFQSESPRSHLPPELPGHLHCKPSLRGVGIPTPPQLVLGQGRSGWASGRHSPFLALGAGSGAAPREGRVAGASHSQGPSATGKERSPGHLGEARALSCRMQDPEDGSVRRAVSALGGGVRDREGVGQRHVGTRSKSGLQEAQCLGPTSRGRTAA